MLLSRNEASAFATTFFSLKLSYCKNEISPKSSEVERTLFLSSFS